MKNFPTDWDEKRRFLMEAVEEVRPTLEAHALESEEQATLSKASVDALYDSGLLRLKLPHVLGGAEADPVTQLDVLEGVSRIDASAGWCLMIGAASLGILGAFLPDEALPKVFEGGVPPHTSGVFAPSGTATPVDGGFLVSGRWSFGSGIRHSQWVSAGARVATEEEGYPEQVRLAMRTSQVKIHDNWQVMGLRGTGSCDFSVDNLFLPSRYVTDPMLDVPMRGGPLYLMGRPGFVTNEHSAFALGVARRALDAAAESAIAKFRGYSSSNLVAHRPVFQRALGEGDLKLRGARALNVEALEEAWEVVSGGNTPGPEMQARLRAVAAYTTDVAVEVATTCFRYCGGEALFQSSVVQRCLRDINAAAQHQMVSDTAYENYGQFMLDMPEPPVLE